MTEGFRVELVSFGWQVSVPLEHGRWDMGTHPFLPVALWRAWRVRNEPTTSPVP